MLYEKYNAKDIESVDTCPLFSDRTKSEIGTTIGRDAKGVLFPNSRTYIRVMTEWNYMNCVRREDPCIFYERNVIDRSRMFAIISYCCLDYIFLSSSLPRIGIMYRNNDTLTMGLSTPGVIKSSVLSKCWENWDRDLNMVGTSRHYLAEVKYGLERKITSIAAKHLSSLMDRAGEYIPYALMHTLGCTTANIRGIESLGFMWNRPMQVWIGDWRKIDARKLEDFIRGDNLLTPENMGFVPEWFAEKELGGGTLTARGTVEFKESSAEFDNTSLWNMLF